MEGLLEYTFLHMFFFVFKPKFKFKESYHSRCPPCCVVGTRWYVHPLDHSDQTKCIRSPFIGDMRTNHPITGLGGLLS